MSNYTKEQMARNQQHPLADFRRFLCRAFRVLIGKDPTVVQYMIADVMQNIIKAAGRVPLPVAPDFLERYPMCEKKDADGNGTGEITKRLIVQAYRGFGKSWIAALAASWVLLWEKGEQVLCVSAAQTKSDEFTSFVLQCLHEIPELSHLIPDGRPGSRSSALKFDVAGIKPAQAPSVRSCGIFGQLTGGRGGVVIPDDIEVPKTSETPVLREKLAKISSEMGGAVLSKGGVMLGLGTPQCEETVYDIMVNERGYSKIVFPARMPDDKWLANYGEYLAPFVHEMLEELGPESQTGCGLDGTLGIPLDPGRFDETELCEREAEYGRSGFMLQFQLDSSLSDRERYPLRCSDLLVMEPSGEMAPASLSWGRVREKMAEQQCVGLRGDRFYRPIMYSDASLWMPWQGGVMFIDPAGRGKDETAYAVVRMCNGYLWVCAVGGFKEGYDDATLLGLAKIAKRWAVNEVVLEPNFGDGMFQRLIEPVFRDFYPVAVIEGPRAAIQKEKRIIDILEPAFNQHLVVINPEVIEKDLVPHDGESHEQALKRSLFYQITRITRDRGCLAHDDRIDALAGAVHYWMESLGVDRKAVAKARKLEAMKQELRDFESKSLKSSFEQPKRAGWLR